MNRHNNWALIQENAPTQLEAFVKELLKTVILCTLGYMVMVLGFCL